MDIVGEVRALIQEFVPTWNGDLSHLDRSELSSLVQLELIMEIEERFGVHFPDDTELILSPADLIAYIEAHRHAPTNE